MRFPQHFVLLDEKYTLDKEKCYPTKCCSCELDQLQKWSYQRDLVPPYFFITVEGLLQQLITQNNDIPSSHHPSSPIDRRQTQQYVDDTLIIVEASTNAASHLQNYSTWLRARCWPNYELLQNHVCPNAPTSWPGHLHCQYPLIPHLSLVTNLPWAIFIYDTTSTQRLPQIIRKCKKYSCLTEG